MTERERYELQNGLSKAHETSPPEPEVTPALDAVVTHLFEEEMTESSIQEGNHQEEQMASGDFTIPTYPGVVGVGGSDKGCCATPESIQMLAFQSGMESRAMTDSVVHNSKEDVMQVLEAKFETVKAAKETDIRLECLARANTEEHCRMSKEMTELMHKESEKTRELIRDMDERRRKDDAAAALAAALAGINAKLDMLLP